MFRVGELASLYPCSGDLQIGRNGMAETLETVSEYTHVFVHSEKNLRYGLLIGSRLVFSRGHCATASTAQLKI